MPYRGILAHQPAPFSFFTVEPAGWIRGVRVRRYGNTISIFIAGDVGIEIVPDAVTVMVLIGECQVGADVEIHPMRNQEVVAGPI